MTQNSSMGNLRFFALCLSFTYIAAVVDGTLLKHLTEPRSGGGIFDIIKKPKIPAVNVHIQKGANGFGAGASIGSFGFGFSFGGQYVPPKETHVPNGDSHIYDPNPDYPDSGPYFPKPQPDYPDSGPYFPKPQPDYPDSGPHFPKPKPDYPDSIPYVPKPQPDYPDSGPYFPKPKPDVRPPTTWEEETGKNEKHRPGWGEYEDDNPKRGPHEEEYPKRDSYEENKKDKRPDWEDIGETEETDPDTKSENFMDGELVNDGIIQPRLNRKRNKRFVESHVYHVPLLFLSNAKPFKVKVQSHPNSLVKG